MRYKVDDVLYIADTDQIVIVCDVFLDDPDLHMDVYYVEVYYPMIKFRFQVALYPSLKTVVKIGTL